MPALVGTAAGLVAAGALAHTWLTQLGWHRGGWYTARWVDRLLFPANLPSATRIAPGLGHVAVGDFIPDGVPQTRCGFRVEHVDADFIMSRDMLRGVKARAERRRGADLRPAPRPDSSLVP